MSELTELIDANGRYCVGASEWLAQDTFRDLGFDYTVTTVLGCQSSGKSTLLNQLFGTTFPVMDAQLGRQQTTKGLWMAKSDALSEKTTLIIDVEGTDSKERGEDRLTFEHRASLFSLALADVVVVNMWYHDLGRYTASNYGLLKTVLAVNLDLFQQQTNCPKTVLLFVIRDYSERQTPLSTLQDMLYTDINSIWKEIKKPERLLTSTADDFFIFRVVGLPSKFVEPESFVRECEALRKRWVREYCPKTYSRKIPADGFALYCENIWNTIMNQSELDIPSQREMLASFRCEEIKNSVLAQLVPVLIENLQKAQEGRMEDFPAVARETILQALESFTELASRYEECVFIKKREQLLDSLFSDLQRVVDAHLSHVRRSIFERAATELDLRFSQGDDPSLVGGVERLEAWPIFSLTAAKWKDDSLLVFDRVAESLNIDVLPLERGVSHSSVRRRSSGVESPPLDARRFVTDGAREALSESLDNRIDRHRERQLRNFRSALSSSSSVHFAQLASFLSDPAVESSVFWLNVNDMATRALRSAHELYRASWIGLQPPVNGDEDTSTTEEEGWGVECAKLILREARASLEKCVEWLHLHLVDRFQSLFNVDKDGVPQQWQLMSADKIKKIFVESRDKALEISDALTIVQLDPSKYLPEGVSMDKHWSQPLLSDQQKHEVVTRATKQMQRACQEAQILQAAAGRHSYVPIWLYFLLLALGWNEIFAVVTSPVMVIIILTLLAIGGLTYLTGNTMLPLRLGSQAMGAVSTLLMPVLLMFQENASASACLPPPPQARSEEKRKQ